MTSLDIVNRDIEYYQERIEEHKKYCKHYPDIFDEENYEFNIVCLNEQKQIKQDLEILELIIKWKNQINLNYNYDYLDEEESILMKSELKLINNYLSHHFGYIPKCFNKVGDSNE